MTTIKAIVRNGRIEVDEAIDLPDGTELTIPVPDTVTIQEILAQEDSPAAIEGWIRWYDSLEPLEFTEEELAAWEAALQEQREFELAHWEEQCQRIEGLIP